MARPQLTLDGNNLEATPGAGNKQWVAKITGTHPKYNYDRDFIMYQKPRTSERDHGITTLENGDIIEIVYFSHGGKEKPRTYQMFWDGEFVEINLVREALDNPEEFAPEPETHECEECGKEFDTERGVAIHAGHVHKDEEDEEEEAEDKPKSPETEGAAVAVTDGDEIVDDAEWKLGERFVIIVPSGKHCSRVVVDMGTKSDRGREYEYITLVDGDDYSKIYSYQRQHLNEMAMSESVIRREGNTTADDGLATDGGVDVDDYAIDPTEIEYDVENQTRDTTNNRTNHVSRIKGTDIWVAYRTWHSGPSEMSHSVKGIGRISFEAVDLDTDDMAAKIREEAASLRVADSDDDDALSLADELVEKADGLAKALETGWQVTSTEYGPRDALYDGWAGVDATTVWVSHVEEAIGHEAEDALHEVGIEKDEYGSAMDIARQTLYDGVSQRRDRWLRPHLDYEARLSFDAEPWELRAIEFEQKSVLQNKMQLAKTAALLREGRPQREIAETLGLAASTTSEHVSRLEDLLDRAVWTTKNIKL